MKKQIGILVATSTLVAFALTVVFWVGVVYSVAAVGVSFLKVAKNTCGQSMKIESLIRHGELFCPTQEPTIDVKR
jgi:hypothetical protein